ncbi:hypothetical protein, partial [Effusibacillus pohliae]|uniref:hypothetical protein n=1 Tax=Effusibacillus pohliae TaxID=232270 RepID=UPI001B7FB12B
LGTCPCEPKLRIWLLPLNSDNYQFTTIALPLQLAISNFVSHAFVIAVRFAFSAPLATTDDILSRSDT